MSARSISKACSKAAASSPNCSYDIARRASAMSIEDDDRGPGREGLTDRCIESVDMKAPGNDQNGTASKAPSSP